MLGGKTLLRRLSGGKRSKKNSAEQPLKGTPEVEARLAKMQPVASNLAYVPVSARITPEGQQPARRSQPLWMGALAPGSCFAGGPAL